MVHPQRLERQPGSSQQAPAPMNATNGTSSVYAQSPSAERASQSSRHFGLLFAAHFFSPMLRLRNAATLGEGYHCVAQRLH